MLGLVGAANEVSTGLGCKDSLDSLLHAGGRGFNESRFISEPNPCQLEEMTGLMNFAFTTCHADVRSSGSP